MKASKILALVSLLALVMPAVGQAVITFNQLAENVFVVSHRVKLIGSRGQAMKLAYTKAASLCVAAGFSHMEVQQQESQAGGEYETANASLRVKMFMETGEDRLDCRTNANPEHTTEAANKLAKRGYRPPEIQSEDVVVEEAEGDAESALAASTPKGRCSIEQIVAMVEAGLSVEQIKAACPEDEG